MIKSAKKGDKLFYVEFFDEENYNKSFYPECAVVYVKKVYKNGDCYVEAREDGKADGRVLNEYRAEKKYLYRRIGTVHQLFKENYYKCVKAQTELFMRVVAESEKEYREQWADLAKDTVWGTNPIYLKSETEDAVKYTMKDDLDFSELFENEIDYYRYD